MSPGPSRRDCQGPWKLYSHKLLGRVPWTSKSALCVHPGLAHHPLKGEEEIQSQTSCLGSKLSSATFICVASGTTSNSQCLSPHQ